MDLSNLKRPHPNTLNDLLALSYQGEVANFWKQGIRLYGSYPGFGYGGFPTDMPGHIFLGRALNLVGAFMFGDVEGEYIRTPSGARACAERWSGYELAFFEREPLPSDYERATIDDHAWGHVLALIHNVRPLPNGKEPFTTEAWQRVVAISEDASLVSSRSQRRVEAMYAWFAAALREARIACKSLNPRTGVTTEFPASAWALPDVTSRFVSCRVYPEDFSRPVAQRNPPEGFEPRRATPWWLHPGDTAWLYVDAKDLHREIAELPFAHVAACDLTRSPAHLADAAANDGVATQTVNSLSEETAKRRGGGKAKYNWPAFKDAALEVLRDEGGFDAADPKWDCQARLEDRMKLWCLDKWSAEPSESMIRVHCTAAVSQRQNEQCGRKAEH